MIKFSLLPSPNAVWLRSFWLVMSLSSGLLVGALVVRLFSPHWFTLGIMVGLVLAIPGLIRPQSVSIPYRAWNKLARLYTRYASNGLLLIWFYLVFGAVGHSESSSLRLARPLAAKSLWVPRGVQTVTSSHGSQQTTIEEAQHRSWISAFLMWATRTSNWWAYCLLPFFMLLAPLAREHEDSPAPVDIYPLF
jgi:hypothetical protein